MSKNTSMQIRDEIDNLFNSFWASKIAAMTDRHPSMITDGSMDTYLGWFRDKRGEEIAKAI